MILIKGATVFSPSYLGQMDVLIGAEKILEISQTTIDSGNLNVEVIDGTGKLLVPGFIDAHVHICGGGGEGGFKSRTPELKMTEMIQAGVTTVVGCLGTDGITRTMENLIAKVYGLREEGVSAYCYSGSYQVPVRTLTGDIMKDIMLIDPIIGLGEIALNDHRSSSCTPQELARLASEARVAGILSGKAGIINCHLGDGPFNLSQIENVVKDNVIPLTQFYPTHTNRNPELFECSIAYGLKGGMLDITTSTTPQFIEEGEVPAAESFVRYLKAGIPIEQITFTSDGHGSLPKFNAKGEFDGLGVGKLDSLHETFVSLVKDYDLTVDQALLPVTLSPANYLKLKHKGRIEVGKDADLLLLNAEDLSIETVVARGVLAMVNNELKVYDTISL